MCSNEFDANEMQRVPWMCWKRVSDNWKACILAYTWPVPISSRILWRLLLQNHFKMNRDFFFFILSVRDLWNFIYFCVCSIGEGTSSGGELGTSIGRHSILILGSAKALNSATTWHERRHGGLRRRGKGLFSNNRTQGPQFTLTLDLCSVCESYSWCCPIAPKEEQQLIRLLRFPGCL